MQVIDHLRDALDGKVLFHRIVCCERRVRLDLRVVDFRADDAFFAYEIGIGQALAPVSEFVMYFPFEIAGLVVVQERRAGRAGILGCEIGRQFARLEFDQCQRLLGSSCIHRRHRGHRLAAIADAAARQGIFVHGDRQNPVGVRAVVAGNDANNALQGTRLGYVKPHNVAMTDRAVKESPDKCVAVFEVRGVLGASGNLLNSVDQRDSASPGEIFILGAHDVVPAAILTDSMIFT